MIKLIEHSLKFKIKSKHSIKSIGPLIALLVIESLMLNHLLDIEIQDKKLKLLEMIKS